MSDGFIRAKDRKPLLIWEPRYPPDEFRKVIEEDIEKCSKQIHQMQLALVSLTPINDEHIQGTKDSIREKIEGWKEHMLDSIRERFILDHPDRPHKRGDRGKMILNDEDEMFIRMKYL